MSPRQARGERRAAERKAKKLELKKSRLSPTAGPLPAETYPKIQPRWNPELEDEFPREVQIRNNAMLDRIALKAGLPIPPPGPDPGNDIESLRQHLLARKAAAGPTKPAAEPPALEPAGFVSQTEPVRPNRAAINRLNAQLSTGPRSPQGKVDEAEVLSEPKTQGWCSSRNAVRHGLASGQLLIPGEDPAAFDALLHDFLEEHQPATATEELLVKEMAQSHWLTQRALRLQNQCFTPDGVNEKQLAFFLRYQTTHERAFYKALNTLLKLKKIGFVSQRSPKAMANAGLINGLVDGSGGFVSHAATDLHSGGAPKPAATPCNQDATAMERTA